MNFAFIPGEEIEARSLAVIEKEVGEHGFNEQEWPIVRRMIHATADFSLAPLVKFQHDAVAAGKAALRAGVPIITDINMVKTGISLARLQKVNTLYAKNRVHCRIADPIVTAEAKTAQLPRAIYSVRSLKRELNGGIICIGNAPTALWEVCRLWKEEQIRPALVIAMPVGFVNVVESKEMIAETDLPAIIVTGRRGGTSLAVAALNALAVQILQDQ